MTCGGKRYIVTREREIEEENLSKEMTYMCSHGLVVYGAGKSTDRISAGSSVFCQDVLLALALAPSQARASTAKYEQGFSLLNYSATEVTIPLNSLFEFPACERRGVFDAT